MWAENEGMEQMNKVPSQLRRASPLVVTAGRKREVQSVVTSVLHSPGSEVVGCVPEVLWWSNVKPWLSWQSLLLGRGEGRGGVVHVLAPLCLRAPPGYSSWS
jgi:hypothetical protein